MATLRRFNHYRGDPGERVEDRAGGSRLSDGRRPEDAGDGTGLSNPVDLQADLRESDRASAVERAHQTCHMGVPSRPMLRVTATRSRRRSWLPRFERLPARTDRPTQRALAGLTSCGDIPGPASQVVGYAGCLSGPIPQRWPCDTLPSTRFSLVARRVSSGSLARAFDRLLSIGGLGDLTVLAALGWSDPGGALPVGSLEQDGAGPVYNG